MWFLMHKFLETQHQVSNKLFPWTPIGFLCYFKHSKVNEKLTVFSLTTNQEQKIENYLHFIEPNYQLQLTRTCITLKNWDLLFLVTLNFYCIFKEGQLFNCTVIKLEAVGLKDSRILLCIKNVE